MYVSNFYDDRHVELFNPDFFFSKSILMNWNTLPSSLSLQVIWTKLLISNSQKKKTHMNHREKRNQSLLYQVKLAR